MNTVAKELRNCLNCKYEPDWGDWFGGEYLCCAGTCKWNKTLPDLPATWKLEKSYVVRYEDGSGLPKNCKTWTVKNEDNKKESKP